MKKKDLIILGIIVLISILAFFIISQLLRKPLVSNEKFDNVTSISVGKTEIEDSEKKEELYELLKNVYARERWLFQPCMCFKVEGTLYYITIEYVDGAQDEIYISNTDFIARPLSGGHNPPLIMSYTGYNKIKNYLSETFN